MSSFNASLFFTAVSGVKLHYPLMHCSYESHRKINEEGRPVTKINSGIISLVFRDPVDEYILEWGLNPHKYKDGIIKFFSHVEELASFRTLEFEHGYCVYLSESFTAGNTAGALVTSINISCEKLKIGNIGHDNKWPS
ncbi:type VI secretion system tube protein TssD [Chitinophagaceae bacterium LWZ2-11]